MGRKKVAIVGGGITGLSVAFYLQSEIKKNHLPIDVVLIEAKPRLGGKIETIKRDGFIIERGPDSFLERKKKRYAAGKGRRARRLFGEQ